MSETPVADVPRVVVSNGARTFVRELVQINRASVLTENSQIMEFNEIMHCAISGN